MQTQLQFFDPSVRKTFQQGRDKTQKHILIQSDVKNKATIKKSSIDLIVTSPPYNVGKNYSGKSNEDAISYSKYLDFTKTWVGNCYHWAKATGRLCVN